MKRIILIALLLGLTAVPVAVRAQLGIGVDRDAQAEWEEIAQKLDTSVSLIMLLNSIRNPRRLYAGRVILVPVGDGGRIEDEAFFPKWGFNTQEISYEIQMGDTLWDIASTYGTDIETILAINGLSFDSMIRPGDEIALWIETAFCR